MKKALIVIDYVNDFVHADGALTCGQPAQAIDGVISKLVRDFVFGGDFVFIATDSHDANDAYHPERGLFPAHCIGGGWGAELYGETKIAAEALRDSAVQLNKRRYSAFSGTDLDHLLRERGVSEVHLTGVCTDICVLHTAVDAYNLGYKIVVHKDAVASFNQTGHQFALEHFSGTLGADVV